MKAITHLATLTKLRVGVGGGAKVRIIKKLVKQCIDSLNEFKPVGPDAIHTRILKELAQQMSKHSLSYLREHIHN